MDNAGYDGLFMIRRAEDDKYSVTSSSQKYIQAKFH